MFYGRVCVSSDEIWYIFVYKRFTGDPKALVGKLGRDQNSFEIEITDGNSVRTIWEVTIPGLEKLC